MSKAKEEDGNRKRMRGRNLEKGVALEKKRICVEHSPGPQSGVLPGVSSGGARGEGAANGQTHAPC